MCFQPKNLETGNINIKLGSQSITEASNIKYLDLIIGSTLSLIRHIDNITYTFLSMIGDFIEYEKIFHTHLGKLFWNQILKNATIEKQKLKYTYDI